MVKENVVTTIEAHVVLYLSARRKQPCQIFATCHGGLWHASSSESKSGIHHSSFLSFLLLCDKFKAMVREIGVSFSFCDIT